MNFTQQQKKITANMLFIAGSFFYVLYFSSCVKNGFSFYISSPILWSPLLGIASYYNFYKDERKNSSTWLYFLFFFAFWNIRSFIGQSPKIFNLLDEMSFHEASQFGMILSVTTCIFFIFYFVKHIRNKSSKTSE